MRARVFRETAAAGPLAGRTYWVFEVRADGGRGRLCHSGVRHTWQQALSDALERVGQVPVWLVRDA